MTGSGAIISGLHATIAGRETSGTSIEMDFDANGNVVYYGIAFPSSNIADNAWQIKKFFYDGNGNLLQVLFASGKPTFENMWTNRAALSYS